VYLLEALSKPVGE